jgi:hypothetical protein
VDAATLVVVGPFDGRDLPDRVIERVTSYTVFADGSLEVAAEGETLHFDADAWTDVRWANT